MKGNFMMLFSLVGLLSLSTAFADSQDNSGPSSGTVSGTDAIIDQDNTGSSPATNNNAQDANTRSDDIGNDGETMGYED